MEDFRGMVWGDVAIFARMRGMSNISTAPKAFKRSRTGGRGHAAVSAW